MTRWQDAHGPTWNGLREMHLFAGAGGGILGGLLLGHAPVCAVEIDPYCQEVLRARQRDGMLPEFPIHDDIRTFDGTPWAGRVDVVAGGFPCQDISVAGKGAGIDGERSGLWREMARVIGEVRPRFAFVENSPALVGRGLAVVLGDLAALGYDARWTVLGAHHVGAPHKRDRLWILAESGGTRARGLGRAAGDEEWGAAGEYDAALRPRDGEDGADWIDAAGHGTADMADTDTLRRDGWAGQLGASGRAESTDGGSVPFASCQGLAQREGAHGERAFAAASRGRRWPAEPRLGRGPDGLASWMDRSTRGAWPRGGRWERGLDRVMLAVPNRVGRLRAIGNGQVPQAAAAAWREMMGWEVPA